MIMDAFLIGNDNTNSPLSHLVKRLQEALGKAEEFDVLTALPSGGGEPDWLISAPVAIF